MSINNVVNAAPNFPAPDQLPVSAWFVVGPYVVDADSLPTLAQVQAFLGTDAASVTVKQAESDRVAGILTDPARVALLNQLKTATAAQIDTYVDAQVTDLASARTMLKRIIKVLALIAR